MCLSQIYITSINRPTEFKTYKIRTDGRLNYIKSRIIEDENNTR